MDDLIKAISAVDIPAGRIEPDSLHLQEGTVVEINLSPDNLKELANLVAPLLTINQPEPDWVKLKDARDNLFAGKSPAWIRLFVFDAFPEVQIENGQSGAWVKGVHGQGSVTKIYLPYARVWMHEHHDDVEWTAKMP